MLTALGCVDRPIGWRHHGGSGSNWYATSRGGAGSAAVVTPDLFGSVFQQRTLHHQHHHRQQQQQQRHYPPAAAAFASLLHQASSVVAPAAAALVPYFKPQSNSDDTEKPIGCGAFGIVWCVPVWHCCWAVKSIELSTSDCYARQMEYLNKTLIVCLCIGKPVSK